CARDSIAQIAATGYW
nr:immunoglobulin heavy chain junction region [Macaca mulatta]